MNKDDRAILRLLVKNTAMRPEEIEAELGIENVKPILAKLARGSFITQSVFGYAITGRGLDNLPTEYNNELVKGVTIRN